MLLLLAFSAWALFSMVTVGYVAFPKHVFLRRFLGSEVSDEDLQGTWPSHR